jgi:hypothetical protein
MRSALAVLPIAFCAAACSSDSDTIATPTAAIALEYSAKDPEAAAEKAQKECAVYGRTARQRPEGEGSKPNVITFDCV